MQMEAKAGTPERVYIQSVFTEAIPISCPSCKLKLSVDDMADHYEVELKRLNDMTEQNDRRRNDFNTGSSCGRKKPWSVFQKVQRNRQSRLRRTRNRKLQSHNTEQACPVCYSLYPLEEIELHAEQCLRRKGDGTNGQEVNSSDEEEYEEYEWAGQKRVRVSSMVQGGYAAIGVGRTFSLHNGVRQNGDDDEDEDLNVDEDDTHIYGPSQYAESDIIPPADDEFNYFRKSITGGEGSNEPSCSTPAGESMVESPTSSTTENDENINTGIPILTPFRNTRHQHVIESLKARLRHLENHTQNKLKCLICLDEYRKPAISVACWHVHCEECWLRSLGIRKLCPQCNLITTPKDLRRIFM